MLYPHPVAGTRRSTERCRSHCANPPTHLRLVLFIHVEEMGHRGMNRRPRPVIRCHIHDTAEHLQEACIPIFGDMMQRVEPGIDEGLEARANRFATLPIRNAKIADRILHEAVEALAEGFVVNLLPHLEKPLWWFLLRRATDLHVSLLGQVPRFAVSLMRACNQVIRRSSDLGYAS